jgi:hypothetical protein
MCTCLCKQPTLQFSLQSRHPRAGREGEMGGSSVHRQLNVRTAFQRPRHDTQPEGRSSTRTRPAKGEGRWVAAASACIVCTCYVLMRMCRWPKVVVAARLHSWSAHARLQTVYVSASTQTVHPTDPSTMCKEGSGTAACTHNASSTALTGDAVFCCVNVARLTAGAAISPSKHRNIWEGGGGSVWRFWICSVFQ